MACINNLSTRCYRDKLFLTKTGAEKELAESQLAL